MNNLIEINKKVLVAQSRSFSIPILKLEQKLKLPIMVEYNLNKHMDTIEDNPKLATQVKVNKLNTFIDLLNQEQDFHDNSRNLIQHTPDHEVHVFTHAHEIFELFKSLPIPMRELSKGYCQEMAKGMIEFLCKPIQSLQDLNHYCYYVAGTVGMYLTDVVHFYYPFTESISIVKGYAKHYGLFLQKLNILRDFHEDKNEKQRSFWPADLIKSKGKEETFQIIANTILVEDIPNSIKYYQSIPKEATSYLAFNRFIIMSSLEYLKLILSKRSIFNESKLKLSRAFIQTLYKRIQKFDANFIDKCLQLKIECEQLQ